MIVRATHLVCKDVVHDERAERVCHHHNWAAEPSMLPRERTVDLAELLPDVVKDLLPEVAAEEMRGGGHATSVWHVAVVQCGRAVAWRSGG